jgi:hypothetical protein
MAKTGTTYGTRETKVNWSAAVWAGVIAGMIFLVLEMIMVPLFLGISPWAPPRMIAAILMGQGVLPPPATFSLGIFVVAMIVHFPLSILYAFILSPIIFRVATGPSLLVGAVFGLLLYLVNFFVFTAIFPWFAEARNWVSIFTHIVFGLVAAWSYKAKANPTPRT